MRKEVSFKNRDRFIQLGIAISSNRYRKAWRRNLRDLYRKTRILRLRHREDLPDPLSQRREG